MVSMISTAKLFINLLNNLVSFSFSNPMESFPNKPKKLAKFFIATYCPDNSFCNFVSLKTSLTSSKIFYSFNFC
jgi:hypothetical protein